MSVQAFTVETAIENFRLAGGFAASATACGLKASGKPDLLLLVANAPCTAAGVFTKNRVQAAPVLYDRNLLAMNADRIRAVVANSGCANACTGERGLADAHFMAELAASAARIAADQVLVLSTGVIGVALDMEKLQRGLAAMPARTPDGAPAARAIMTTDTKPKVAAATLEIGGRPVRIAGFAKGAGMIHPDMATMLSVITTDARVPVEILDASLRSAVEQSFNRISVDGDMSTNDTVLLLASGASGVAIGAAERAVFDEALAAVSASLARQIARDGEGATRLVEIHVTGAANDTQAHRVANKIATSLLVKTAIHGGDPNWGRILAAAGASGESIEPSKTFLAFGGDDAVHLVERGAPLDFDRALAAERLRRDPVEIHLDLGLGGHETRVWTCDLSAEYVAINADYTT